MGALVLQAVQIIRDEIRVAQTEHFSPGVPTPLQPAIAQDASISPLASLFTAVTSPQSGHLPGIADFCSTSVPELCIPPICLEILDSIRIPPLPSMI